MVRFTIFISLLALLVGSGAPAFGQGVPGCYPVFCPPPPKCEPKPRVEPIRRTVQVDVPVPCAPMVCLPPVMCPPVGCMPRMMCRPNPCCPPPCPPPCPTRPVEVKIDVRVRAEPCGQPQPERKECRDFGALGPVIGMAAATLSVPIRVLEGIFPGPIRCAAPGPWYGPTVYPHHAVQQFVPGSTGPVASPAAWHPATAPGFAPAHSACSPRKSRLAPLAQEGHAR